MIWHILLQYIYYGACHSVELAYIFDNLKEGALIGDKNINYKLVEI